MSTRSNTRIKEGDNIIILYKHHDGYPEGVGAYLTNILKKYGFKLFKNSDYLSVLNSEDISFDGFEEDDCYAGDSEYIYTIDLNKKTLSYIDKYPCDDDFEFDKIDEMDSKILYDAYDDQSIIDEIEFHRQKITELKEKLKEIEKMKAEDLINDDDFEITEYIKFHWKFIWDKDHINIYDIREGDIIGGLYAPEAPYTMKDIIEKMQDMDEAEVYNFIEDYIEWF